MYMVVKILVCSLMCLGEYYVSVWKKYFDMNVMVKIIFVSILLWIYI